MREKKRTVPCTLTIKKGHFRLGADPCVYFAGVYRPCRRESQREGLTRGAEKRDDIREDYEMTYIWGLDVLRTCDCDCVVRVFCVFSS